MIFQEAYCIGNIEENPGQSDLTVHATITDMVDNGYIQYIASSPPDYHSSYTGSALPFANPEQAFQNTPNKGEITLQGNQFSLKLLTPNTYYEGLGRVLVPPTLYVHYTSGGVGKTIKIKVGESIPYRRLTYPTPRRYAVDNPTFATGPLFYSGTNRLPIRTQEKILRDACYPSENKTPADWWGLKPRC